MPPRGDETPASAGAFGEEDLIRLAERFGTPAYVYDLAAVHARAAALRRAFEGLELAFAIKANPNPTLLARLAGTVDGLDVSSGGEIERALEAGWPARCLRFSGPAKREAELRLALERGVGDVALESLEEARTLGALARAAGRAAGRERTALVRIDPRSVPRGFGVQLGGKPSRFGVDEELLEETLPRVLAVEGLAVRGFHVFAGTQCLDAESLVANLTGTAALFERAARLLGRAPEVLVFGAGFGIPYAETDEPFSLEAVAAGAAPALGRLRERFPRCRMVLELGRWLVGEAGLYLTRVQRVKRSRGTELAICDGGMHQNLAASGHLGGVLHRNYRMFVPGGSGPRRTYDVVGPLCTAIDVLGRRVELPELSAGSLVAVRSSGAYGPTASPLQFLAHPPPLELLVEPAGEDGWRVGDVSVRP